MNELKNKNRNIKKYKFILLFKIKIFSKSKNERLK